jgi:hypothetical protein
MELSWRSLGTVRSDSESVRSVGEFGVSRAVWKLAYSLRGQRVVYVGSTGSLTRHVKVNDQHPPRHTRLVGGAMVVQWHRLTVLRAGP